MEDRHYKGDRIEFPVSESKGKKRKRVIYLTDKAKAAITEKKGLLFKNSRGTPWTPYSIANRMDRIAKKTGKKFSLYDFRHAFATRMLLSGLDHTVVAQLLGHSDASMLCRVYSHLGQSSEFLKQQLKKTG